MPWQRKVTIGVQEIFDKNKKITIRTFSEFTGLSHFWQANYVNLLIDFYRHKYSRRKIDLILAVDPDATSFALKHGDALFPGLPIVFIISGRVNIVRRKGSSITGVAGRLDIKCTLAAALKLQPRTRRVVVIAGVSPIDRLYLGQVRTVLKAYQNRLRFTYLVGLPLSELLSRVARLPRHTIIFYVLTLKDRTGATHIPQHVVERLAARANAPIYGLWDTFIGHGLVGGSLSSGLVLGRKAAQLALRVLSGEKASDIPIVTAVTANMYDWRQLRRWDLDVDRLPPGSIVQYRTYSVWYRYRGYIIAVALFVILQSLLIGFLLFNWRRRYRVEADLRRARDELEIRVEERTAALHQANQDLSREIDQRRRTEGELRESLAQVKQLSGLLPICSSCKKIRNDEGYWEQVEGYITKHSDAQFSHGICPKCARKLYPELFDKKDPE